MSRVRTPSCPLQTREIGVGDNSSEQRVTLAVGIENRKATARIRCPVSDSTELNTNLKLLVIGFFAVSLINMSPPMPSWLNW